MIGKIQAYFNNLFWLFLTYSLTPCFYFSLLFRERKENQFKILVVQTAKIGDMICTTPVFREIKQKYPSCRLTVICLRKVGGILKNNPRIDEILFIDDYPGIRGKTRLIRELRKEKYNWAINLLPGSFNNIIAFWSLIPNRATTCHSGAGIATSLLSIFNNHRLEFKSHTSFTTHYLNLLKFLDIEQVSEGREIFIQSEEEKKALNFLTQNNLNLDDLLVGISPVPGNKIKQWDLSKYAALSDLLIEKLGAKIVFTGSADDGKQIESIQKMMRNNSINGSGYFKLYEAPALLKRIKLFISVDSGPLYIADALRVPVVNIGGSYDIQEQAPSGNKCKILQKYPVSCSFIVPASSACREKHLKNLREITPEEVFEAAVELVGPAP